MGRTVFANQEILAVLLLVSYGFIEKWRYPHRQHKTVEHGQEGEADGTDQLAYFNLAEAEDREHEKIDQETSAYINNPLGVQRLFKSGRPADQHISQINQWNKRKSKCKIDNKVFVPAVGVGYSKY